MHGLVGAVCGPEGGRGGQWVPFCGPGPPLRQVLSLLVPEDSSGYTGDHMVGLNTLIPVHIHSGT